nr:hypothetical protein [uncultured Rhodopila sp.]
MTQPSMKAAPPAVHALRKDLSLADDQKIKRVIAMLDDVADPKMNQTLLDPLRVRLASLNLVRPLRFTRLLFLPLDPVIVAPRDWKPEEPAVPRTALAPLARTVRAGLGAEAVFIDKTIAGRKTDAMQAITLAGEALWPRAAEVLAAASPSDDWAEAGLSIKVFQPLSRAVAAVLRRGPQLRWLLRDEEVGVFESAEQAVADILKDIGKEPPEGCALIARLILLQSPHAAPLLRRFVASGGDQAAKAMVRRAIDQGTEQMLSDMESDTALSEELSRGPLANVGAMVRRITTFLHEIEEDSGAGIDRPRLHAIRRKLDHACRERFSDGLNTGLLSPLAAGSAPVDGTGQVLMESCGRELRELESEARKIGGAANYDRLLQEASAAVKEAAAAGTLTPVRKLRLIEILSGPEAAAALYEQEIAGAPVPRLNGC